MNLRTDRKQVFSRDRMTYRMPAYIRFLPLEDAGISSDSGLNPDYLLYKNLENLYKFSENVETFLEKRGQLFPKSGHPLFEVWTEGHKFLIKEKQHTAKSERLYLCRVIR